MKRDVSKKNEAGCQMPAEIQSESERRETFEEKKIKLVSCQQLAKHVSSW